MATADEVFARVDQAIDALRADAGARLVARPRYRNLPIRPSRRGESRVIARSPPPHLRESQVL